MTSRGSIHRYPDAETLAEAVAARLLVAVSDRLGTQDVVHLVLTGGTVGIKSLAAVAASPARGVVDWSRVHFWWGDERYLPAGDGERNETQARDALLDALGVAGSQIHAMPALAGGVGVDDAAAAYAQELARFAGSRQPGVPDFDILMLGMGPDGHIASLFPGHDTVNVTDATTVGESDSPKPPPQRISLTLPAINTADEVWLVISGQEKAAPAARAVAGQDVLATPAAGVQGRSSTRFLMDDAAAADLS